MKYRLTESAKQEILAQSYTYYMHRQEVLKYIEDEFNAGSITIIIPDKWVIGPHRVVKPTVFTQPDMFEVEDFEPNYGVWYDFKECYKAAMINAWDTVVFRDATGSILCGADKSNATEFAVIEDVPF